MLCSEWNTPHWHNKLVWKDNIYTVYILLIRLGNKHIFDFQLCLLCEFTTFTAGLRYNWFETKMRSVIDKLQHKKSKKFKENNADTTKFYKPYEKICFKEYKNRKVVWKEGIIEKRIGRLVYIIKHPKWIIKRHYNQLKKRYTSGPNYRREEPIKVIYHLFKVPILQVPPEQKHNHL